MFNTRKWALLVEHTYGYPFGIIDDTDPPLYYTRVENEIGKYMVAPPYGDFIHLTEGNAHQISNYLNTKIDCAARIKVCVPNEQAIKPMNPERSGYVHQINFPSYREWNQNLIRGKFRNQIIQGRKNGLTARVSTDEGSLLEFWELHAKLRLKKFGEIPQPKSFFLNLYKSYLEENMGFVISAYNSESELIAGVVILLDSDTAYYKFAASNLDALSARPNNFLIDHLIKYLEGLGLNKLNLGYTGDSANYNGLRKYKLAAGATELVRYNLKTDQCDSLDHKVVKDVNHMVTNLINKNPNLDDVDKFSERYYKYFI